jgi:hypothetical protein
MIAAIGGQFLALAHEATVQHFRCAEHGELTHVPTAAGERAEALPALPTSRVVSENAVAGEGHEHCGVAFTVRDGAPPPVVRTVSRYTPPPSAVRVIRTVAQQPGRAFVLASAPKTSPPSA